MPRKDPLARKRAQIAALDARIGERLDEITRDRRALLRLRKQVAALEAAGPPARPAKGELTRGGPRKDRAAQRAARPVPKKAPVAPAEVAPKRKPETRAASERRSEPRQAQPAPGPVRSPPKRRAAKKAPPKPATAAQVALGATPTSRAPAKKEPRKARPVPAPAPAVAPPAPAPAKPAKKSARRRAPVAGPGAMRSLKRAQRRLEELGVKPYKPKVLHGAAAAAVEAARGRRQAARR